MIINTMMMVIMIRQNDGNRYKTVKIVVIVVDN